MNKEQINFLDNHINLVLDNLRKLRQSFHQRDSMEEFNNNLNGIIKRTIINLEIMKKMKLTEFVKIINDEREKMINEIACWDTKKIVQDRDTVSCDEDEKYEREVILKSIKKEFGYFTEEQISNAIEECCKDKNQSRKREDFYKCVYGKLFSKI